MNWFGSGFVWLLNYGLFAEASVEEFTLETENNFDILTEDGKSLLIES